MSNGTPPPKDRLVPQWTFADRLRKARKTTGLQQREFAEALAVRSPAYQQWESGNARPRDLIAVCKRIELLTGVPAGWMLGLEADAVRQELPHLDSNQEPAG